MFLLIIWDIIFVSKLVYSLKYFEHNMQFQQLFDWLKEVFWLPINLVSTFDWLKNHQYWLWHDLIHSVAALSFFFCGKICWLTSF